jgi:hypothetical protein
VSRGRLDLVRQRLGQHLGHRSLRAFETPSDVVQSFGAVQAQDYLGSLWAIGLRLPGSREADIERALSDKSIVRTWPMRGTLHIVAAADVRWMLALLTPAIVARGARRLAELDIGEADLRRSRKALVRALQGGRQRTRKNVYEVLEAAKVSTAGQRGIHVLWRLAQEGLVCFGARDGKQPTFVLLDEWVPPAPALQPDEALAAIAERYFGGHGPATLADFTWWSGLPVGKAREGLESVRARLEREVVGDGTYWYSRHGAAVAGRSPKVSRVHLLPAFDEYLVGYRDRRAVLAANQSVNNGWGLLSPTVLVNGSVAGTWGRELRGAAVTVALAPFEPLKAVDSKALPGVVNDYGEFLGKTASIRVRTRPRTVRR